MAFAGLSRGELVNDVPKVDPAELRPELVDDAAPQVAPFLTITSRLQTLRGNHMVSDVHAQRSWTPPAAPEAHHDRRTKHSGAPTRVVGLVSIASADGWDCQPGEPREFPLELAEHVIAAGW